MRSNILHIGIINKANRVDSVSFTNGVNVITGKSSTGKSAMIEICDYCFGSSEFPVPDGVITDNSQIYLVVIRVKEAALILARRPDSNEAFLKEEVDEELISDPKALAMSYFAD